MRSKFNSKTLTLLVCILLATFLFVACNGNASKDANDAADTQDIGETGDAAPVEEKPNPFIGTWVLETFEDFGNEEIITAEDILEISDDMKLPDIIIKPDNTVVFTFFEEEENEVWEMKDDTTIIMGTDDTSGELVIIDGKLILEDEDSKMIYIKK